MTTVAGAGSRSKKQKVNKKLLYVLGVVFVLVVGLKVMPGLLGGGATSAQLKRPTTSFHFHKAPLTAPGSVGVGAAVARVRDPFAPPPGYAAGH